jgi:orotidine-5'-phosphate decarboxylase
MIFDILSDEIRRKRNPSCVGLDTSLKSLPPGFQHRFDTDTLEGAAEAVFAYNKELIDALEYIVPAVKVQVAFYEMYGVPGMRAFQNTLQYAKRAGFVVIVDAKRNDIASTAEAYAKAFLGEVELTNGSMPVFDADIVTVNPYLGTDGIAPFLNENPRKGIFALVKTSNPSSAELQDQKLEDGRAVYEAVGDLVLKWGQGTAAFNGFPRVGAVVGATYPEQGSALRKRMPGTFFLLPGYGAQGAKGADIAGMFDKRGRGAVVNSSRAILCAWEKTNADFKTAACEAAIKMRDDINAALKG